MRRVKENSVLRHRIFYKLFFCSCKWKSYFEVSLFMLQLILYPIKTKYIIKQFLTVINKV